MRLSHRQSMGAALKLVLRVETSAPILPGTSFTIMSWAESSARYTSISTESAVQMPQGLWSAFRLSRR